MLKSRFLMYFFADLIAASQYMLRKVGQEAAIEYAKKDAKSAILTLSDTFKYVAEVRTK